MSKSKKYLKAIEDFGKQQDFVDFLLRCDSTVINIYAAKFCKKYHIKARDLTPEEQQKQLEDLIVIAKTPWLDKFGD